MNHHNEKEPDVKEKQTAEERGHRMWEQMMDCCRPDMTEDEKKKWKKDMKKRMFHMKGHMGPMMGMMGHGMGGTHGKHAHFNPGEMCRDMLSSLKDSQRLAVLATPEVQGLFEDWVEQIEQEILDYMKDRDTADISKISKHFKISKDSAYYFLTRLAQKGRLKINVSQVKSVEKGPK